ncbi:MAG: hypothetical protein KKC68_07535 [Candidatus Thermoplasmatota archaeon]|nr:hypothetical protein [Candidatus Thermoplasmatota archaeon]MBU1941610.1 hypothetical protein [Candidatus Thermoplasmatota archaeon]
MIKIQTRLNKDVLKFSSYLLAFGLSSILFITFLWSYFLNGKSFSFHIDQFGEALVELHVLLFVFAFLSYSLLQNYKDFKQKTLKK